MSGVYDLYCSTFSMQLVRTPFELDSLGKGIDIFDI